MKTLARTLRLVAILSAFGSPVYSARSQGTLTVTCSSNKTVECGSAWTFDMPAAYSACGGVTVTSAGIVSNGASPLILTETWLIADACGESNTCSQTVTVAGAEAMFSDAAADFASGYSPGNNPNGDWSYGYSTKLGGAFTLDLNQYTSGPLEFWAAPPGLGDLPFLYYNSASTTGGYGTGIDPPGGLITHPGPDCEFAVLRYTAPCSGEYSVSAQFLGADPHPTSTSFYLLTNGVVIPGFSGNITGYGPGSGAAYALAMSLAAGATLDFVVGCGPDNYYGYDSTLISADVARCCASQIHCASNKTVPCGSAWSFDAPVVDDTCSQTNITLSILSIVTNGVCPQYITQTLLATDACGNTNECSQTVTVVDTTPPVLTCASNKTVECGSVWSFDPPTASDTCSGTNVAVSILSTVTNGTCPQLITQTWQATDPCGNSSTCSQTVTVVDTTPPVLTCAPDKTVECGSCFNGVGRGPSEAQETVLHGFGYAGNLGQNPYAALLVGSDGALYGTTFSGGSSGLGTAFKVNRDGSGYTVLYNFTGAAGAEGIDPEAGLIEGSDGALYGTTPAVAAGGGMTKGPGEDPGPGGSAPPCGGGASAPATVFKLNKDGSGYTVLMSFTSGGGPERANGVVEGKDGALYGLSF